MVTRRTSLVAVGLSAIAVAAVVAASPGCSIDSRSDAYACDPGCPRDRTCVDGWCVVRDGGAATDGRGIDGATCPGVCTSCAAGTCTITCDGGGECAAPVQCPPGWTCEVACTGNGSCGGGVRCAPGEDCTVRCEGNNSCAGEVRCDTGRCDATCAGDNSCAGGIDCTDACRCDTQCAPSACQGGTSCPGPAQCEQGGECTSQAGACRSC